MNTNPAPKYNEDYYGWAVHTAQLLKENRMDEINFDEIIEEIESLGRSEKHELIGRLSIVISHLLKWQFQPTMRGHSWLYSIKEQRKRSIIHLKDNPSLRAKLDEVIKSAYDVAISKAARETALDEKDFPDNCPYTFEQIIDEAFYPD